MIIARQSLVRLATSRPVLTTVRGERANLSTGVTPGRLTEETGTSAHPSQGTPASGPPGAAGVAAAPPAGPAPGPGGGGWRAKTAGWETAVGRPRSPSRLATTGPVQVRIMLHK